MTYTAKVGERGQITIPKPVRDEYGLKKGMTVEVEMGEGQICVRRSKREIRAALEKWRGSVNVGDVDAFIEDMRGR
jgi:antitoxin PrlF